MINRITANNYKRELEKNIQLYDMVVEYEKTEDDILRDNISFIIEISNINDVSEKTKISKSKLKNAIKNGKRLSFEDYIKVIAYSYFNKERINMNHIKFRDLDKEQIIEKLKEKIEKAGE